MRISPTALFTWMVSIATISAIAIGVSLIDPPALTRMHKLDDKRVSDLQRISMNINYYRKAHEKLPDNLEQLSLPKQELQDAVTQRFYEYSIHNADTYELCAVFEAAPDDVIQRPFNSYDACSVPWWKREQGRYCFTISTKTCR